VTVVEQAAGLDTLRFKTDPNRPLSLYFGLAIYVWHILIIELIAPGWPKLRYFFISRALAKAESIDR